MSDFLAEEHSGKYEIRQHWYLCDHQKKMMLPDPLNPPLDTSLPENTLMFTRKQE
jgi:hypothetical protein